MTTLPDHIIAEIEKRCLTPTPRWCFVVREYTAWVVLGVAGCAGIAASGLVLFIAANLGTSLAGVPHGLLTVLAVWLAVLACVLALIVTQFKRTERGYRYSLASVAGAALAGGAVGGTLLFACGGMPATDEMVEEYMPGYRSVAGHTGAHWMTPGDGRLMGVVVFVHHPDLVLEDPYGARWVVLMPTSTSRSFTRYAHMHGASVRVTGTTLSQGRFRACAAELHRLQGGEPVWRSMRTNERDGSAHRIQECD